MSKISLNASMRSDLLSLQNTAKLRDTTQLRLSTGLKVNSAIDNPSSYYTAQSLSNRAHDLEALLDTMGQGIQTIKTAIEGIETQTSMIEQASAVASNAVNIFSSEAVPPAVSKEWLSEQEGVVAVVSTKDELMAAVASGTKGDIVIYGEIDCGTDTVALKEGQALRGINYFADKNKNAIDENYHYSQLKFSVQDNSSAIITEGNTAISDLYIYNKSDDTNAISRTVIVAKDNSAKPTYLSNIKIISDGLLSNIVSGAVYLSENIDVKCEKSTRAFGYANVFADNAKINLDGSGTAGVGFYGANRPGEFKNSEINIVGFNSGLSSDWLIIENSKINIETRGLGISCTSGISNGKQYPSLKGSEINITTTNNGAFGIGFTQSASPSASSLIENCQINIKNKGSNSIGIRMTINNNPKDQLLNILNSKIVIESGSNGSIFKNISSSYDFTSLNFLSGTQLSFNGQNWVSTGWNKTFAAGETITSLDGIVGWQKAGTVAALSLPDTNAIVSEAHSRKSDENFSDDEFDNIKDYLNRYEEYMYKSLTNEQKSYIRNFNDVISQVDDIAKDSIYKGINLLQQNSMVINFNEDRTSKLNVEGVDASAKGLGLSEAHWRNQQEINESIKELTSAINQLREFSSQFGNYYSIITTRQEFTENLINVLEEGADKLILADMNEESANMLAIQTREQLATNSLSLASQAAQSVLRLF